MTRHANRDDNIYIVNPPKKDTRPIAFELVARGVQYPRVIPHEAIADPKEWNAVEGKTRGKPAIRVHLSVPTVKLRYRGKVWQEHTHFTIDLPFAVAQKIGKDLVRLAEKYQRGKPR